MQETGSIPASPGAGDEEAPGTNDGRLSRSRHRHHGNTLLMKIIGPVITFVDRPWKASVMSTWSRRWFRSRDLDVPGGITIRFR